MKSEWLEQGLEFLILTPERIDSVVREMEDSGKMSEEEAAKMRRSLGQRAREERERFSEMLEDMIRDHIQKLDLVPREELNELEQRVKAIEGYVDEVARKKRAPRT